MPNKLLRKARNTPNKIKRELLRIPPLQVLSQRIYQTGLNNYLPFLPKISATHTSLVKSLQKEGITITSLEQLGIPNTSKVLKKVQQILPELQNVSSANRDTLRLSWSRIMSNPEIFLWGLEPTLLDLIENYIGLPLNYYGADIRREFPNGKAVHVRQWHIDTEDHKMLKIIIYLNDVDVSSGPFEYLSRTDSELAAKTLKYSSGFVSDSNMDATIPQANWQPCTGKFGTAILVDTCRIFHRAKPPSKKDRFSLTFSYTSHQPVARRCKLKLSPQEWSKITAQLNQRQINCLYYN